jgi:hypothetical protein
MQLRDTLPTIVWGFIFTRIVFTFLSGTVEPGYAFVQLTGHTWAPVIYIVAIALSLGILVFDAAHRWGTSLRGVQLAWRSAFASDENETSGGALRKSSARLWWPFVQVLGILFLFVGLLAGFLWVGYGMFDTGGEIKVYHLGLSMALFVMLLLVVRE